MGVRVCHNFSSRFHFTPVPGLPHPWCISVAHLRRAPLLASSLVFPPWPCRWKPWLLRACSATVLLFPHSVTSRPAPHQQGVPHLPSAPGSLGPLPAQRSLQSPVPSWYGVFDHVFGAAVPLAPQPLCVTSRGGFSLLHKGGEWAAEKKRHCTMVTLFISSRSRTQTQVLAPVPGHGSLRASFLTGRLCCGEVQSAVP